MEMGNTLLKNSFSKIQWGWECTTQKFNVDWEYATLKFILKNTTQKYNVDENTLLKN